MRHFALGGTDHHTHAWQGEMISACMRWRNAHAQPKTSFAPELSHPHLVRLPDQRCMALVPGAARRGSSTSQATCEYDNSPASRDLSIKRSLTAFCTCDQWFGHAGGSSSQSNVNSEKRLTN